MFTVGSVDDTVARLRANGAELVGEMAQYEDKYRLCDTRGPAVSSSRWPRNSSEAFTAFGVTCSALGILRLDPMARNHPGP
jgi:hypothetical protein